MDSTLIRPDTLRWAALLVIGFPIMLVALGEVIRHLQRRHLPLAATLRWVRNLVLPLLALLVLALKILEMPATSTVVRVIETLFWIGLIHTCLDFINDVLFVNPEEGSWQERVPRLLLDLGRVILVVIGGSIVLSHVWGFDLTKLAAALGIGSIVIGLALQEPLGNVFAGLMLLIERPISLGDWITVGGITGKVVQVNWRSVHLETMTREILVVPNSELNKGSFSNLSRPSPIRTEMLDLGFSYNDPPNKVKQVLIGLLEDTPGILDEPPPRVRTVNYADFAIIYRVIFSVSHQEGLYAARDAFMSRVWYAAQRHGLTIPFPIVTEIRTSPEEIAASQASPGEQLRTAFPAFLPTGNGVQERSMGELGAQLKVRTFASGERIVTEGETIEGMYLILSGRAWLTVKDTRGNTHDVVQLGRGEYFGESAVLSGQVSELTVTAIEDITAILIEPELANSLMAANPRLSREIGSSLDMRRQAAQEARRPLTRKPRPGTGVEPGQAAAEKRA